ncbi:hypothetical protein SAY86_009216 [Trapa natans]|uniref:Uncharacterized protein n=1 Tax=Trapa natans TaxID=22666 RepID=A0AAN7KWB7_TRANT|nr:hypothetical protein SAY86_009216 [Trapa natans]
MPSSSSSTLQLTAFPSLGFGYPTLSSGVAYMSSSSGSSMHVASPGNPIYQTSSPASYSYLLTSNYTTSTMQVALPFPRVIIAMVFLVLFCRSSDAYTVLCYLRHDHQNEGLGFFEIVSKFFHKVALIHSFKALGVILI